MGNDACNGQAACRHYNTFIRVNDKSCIGERACHALAPGTIVGVDSCHGYAACECCSGVIPDRMPDMKCSCSTGSPPPAVVVNRTIEMMSHVEL